MKIPTFLYETLLEQRVKKSLHVENCKALRVCLIGLPKGAFNNYMDKILPFSDPPPLRGQFLYPECGQNQTFFDLFPPHLVHVLNGP